MHCRKMDFLDLGFVIQIQNELGFQNWNLKQFESELLSSFSLPLVLILNEKIIGYMLLQVISEEAELLSIAISSDFGRKGAGSFLWNEGLTILKKQNVKKVFLEVRENNKVAQCFYEKHGFVNYGIRKRYYSNGENAFLFRFDF